MKQMPRTIGELKKSGYKVLSVKDEMRKNLTDETLQWRSTISGNYRL